MPASGAASARARQSGAEGQTGAEEGPMKFIIEPQKETKQDKGGRTTLRAKCSENPRFCDEI